MPPPDSDTTSTEVPSLSDTFVGKVHAVKQLRFWPRVLVLSVGWLVILVGIAGLLLPGPGTLAIFAGAAILSVASELAYKGMRTTLKRWPALWIRFEALRSRIHERLHEFFHPGQPT
jgi:hypothetical protein